jgi:hypothetical protein
LTGAARCVTHVTQGIVDSFGNIFIGVPGPSKNCIYIFIWDLYTLPLLLETIMAVGMGRGDVGGLEQLARQIASRRGIDPDIFVRLVRRESNFDPRARGAAGEIGLTQIMSETGSNPGFGVKPIGDRLDPVENLRFGADYLAAMLKRSGGDYSRALAMYNAGPGSIDSGRVPQSTLDYVSYILQDGIVAPSSSPVVASKSSGSDSKSDRLSGKQTAIAALLSGFGSSGASVDPGPIRSMGPIGKVGGTMSKVRRPQVRTVASGIETLNKRRGG